MLRVATRSVNRIVGGIVYGFEPFIRFILAGDRKREMGEP